MRWLAVWAALAAALALAPQSAAAGDASSAAGDTGGSGTLVIPVVFPEHKVTENDAYLCTSVALPDRPLKLIGVEPTSDMRIVHHMLLFGCEAPAQTAKVWDCKMAPTCQGSDAVVYGWGRNAPPISLPHGAGYSVGPGTGIRALVLQMHYLGGRPENDTSGIRLILTDHPQPYSAGMVAFASAFSIPPKKPSHLIPNVCCYSGWEPLHGFATRVHTHALGREVYMDRSRPANRSMLDRVVGIDPQKPQGFYPVEPEVTFLPGDNMAMACNFDSSQMDKPVVAGHTSSDEMCNLYMMLYSHLPYFMWCLDNHTFYAVNGVGGLPAGGRLLPEAKLFQPPSQVTRTGAKAVPYPVGQVSGVASRGDGTLWAFHRGQRAWNPDGTVTDKGASKQGSSGLHGEDVLPGPVVLQLDEETGEVQYSWGAGLFVMPHMITLDWEGNVWLTDVSLHQVFKFSPEGKQLLALGTRLQHGDSGTLFCAPTQVAVARDGGIFVSDGYCNNRIAEFTANGSHVRDYRLPEPEAMDMVVPHSVVYDECRSMLLVANRERGKVHAFKRDVGDYLGHWDLSAEFGAPYSLAIGPYGSVLVLTWQPPKTFIVLLDKEVGTVLTSYEVPGVKAPHDMALLAAPLELTGSGERLLSVVVSETREDGGPNLHKFIFREAAPAPAGAPAAGVAGEEEGDFDEMEVSLAAAKAGAAAHFGGGTQKKAQPAAGSKGGEEAAGGEGEDEARVGHAMVTPVDQSAGSVQQEGDGSAGQAAGEQQEAEGGEEASRVGHAMVKPVGGEEAGAGSKAASQEQQPQQEAAKAAAGQEEAAELDILEKEDQQQAAQGTAAAAAGQQAGSQQQAAEQQQQQEEQEVEEQQAGEQQELAAAAAVDAEETVHHSRDERGPLIHSGVQPWGLGVVFVGVALAAWSRVRHWRRRGGAGYQAAPGAEQPAGGLSNGSAEAAVVGPAVHRHHLVNGYSPDGSSGEATPSPPEDV